jgi:hypothetical protein
MIYHWNTLAKQSSLNKQSSKIMKFENAQEDAEAMLKELALHDIPVTHVPTELQKELRIVAYCYKSAFFGYTSDEPSASPLIHETLYDIVVTNHNGSIDFDHHGEKGDVAVLSLPDPINDPASGATYMIYHWNTLAKRV